MLTAYTHMYVLPMLWATRTPPRTYAQIAPWPWGSSTCAVDRLLYCIWWGRPGTGTPGPGRLSAVWWRCRPLLRTCTSGCPSRSPPRRIIPSAIYIDLIQIYHALYLNQLCPLMHFRNYNSIIKNKSNLLINVLTVFPIPIPSTFATPLPFFCDSCRLVDVIMLNSFIYFVTLSCLGWLWSSCVLYY